MRILLAAKHAPEGRRPIGGVQSWCRTIANELRSRGHEAITWGPEQPAPLGGFDFGIVANVGDTARAFEWCKKALVVSHGIIPAERPRPGLTTVFTSEEIRDHWGVEGEIIRQPIDLDFWSPKVAFPIYLTRFSYRGGMGYVKPLARRLNLTYQHVRNLPDSKVIEILHQSKVVLATGRAALEAMACDAPVVIVDHRAAYQGPLMDPDIPGAMTRNYSGRGGIVPTPDNLKEAIDQAVRSGGLRSHVAAFHDAGDITDQLLEYS